MPSVVLATGNAGKLAEMQNLLNDGGWNVQPQSDFAVPEVAETGLTFVENALIKARHASRYAQMPAIADDSGIEVDALNGQPGIYSARYSGVDATDASNNNKLLDALRDVPTEKRTARYHCVLVYLRHAEDPTPLICHSAWEGSILEAPIGNGGFGYDPLFFVTSHDCSAAQLEKAEKNQISHRGQALQALLMRLTADR